ncbi:unnamed protein product, partial [Bubo scandiacus]
MAFVPESPASRHSPCCPQQQLGGCPHPLYPKQGAIAAPTSQNCPLSSLAVWEVKKKGHAKVCRSDGCVRSERVPTQTEWKVPNSQPSRKECPALPTSLLRETTADHSCGTNPGTPK